MAAPDETLAAAIATCVIALLAGRRYMPHLGGWAVADALIIAWARQFPERVLAPYGLITLSGRKLIQFTIAVNVLFGSLQKITAQQLNLDPVLITTANSTGGVMGKMIDAQSIVVATASTGQQGQEGRILRFVFWHSVVLAAIMGLIVMAQAYVFPWMIPSY